MDIREYEEESIEQVFAQLVSQSERLLGRSLDLSRTLFRAFDEWSDDETNPGGVEQDSGSDGLEREFDFEVEQLVGSSRHSEQVANLAFVAKVELKERLRRVQGLCADHSHWRVISECDSALRRIRKCLAALELALCETTGASPRLGFETELEISLQTRKAYAKLRREVARELPPDDESVRRGLRSAGTLIAMLIGRPVYSKLRVRDRAEIRSIQSRILDWLRSDETDARQGVRIWQDLNGAIDIFLQVSRRQELVQHDHEVLAEAQALIAGLGPQEEVPPEHFRRLQALEGLDDEIDRILNGETPALAGPWCSVVARLCGQFGIGEEEERSTVQRFDGEFL